MCRAAALALLGLAVPGLAACARAELPLRVEAAPAYEAARPPWPPAVSTSRFGRGVAPSRAVPAAIAWGLRVPPVMVERVWTVPGDGPALAVVSGRIAGFPMIEVIDVDAGRVRWRDSSRCQAPVVHVTHDVIVCGDVARTVALAVTTGDERWQRPMRFTGAEGDLVVGVRETAVVVVDADDGEQLAEAPPPPGIEPLTVQRACRNGSGLVMWAWGEGGVAVWQLDGDQPGPPQAIALAHPPSRVEACATPALVEVPTPGSPERELTAIAADAFRAAGPPVVERGYWRDARGRVITATARGIEARDAVLAPVELLSEAQVGRELSARGRRRLVRAAGATAVLLEDERPIAYLSAPSTIDSAVLGDAYVLGGGWQYPARSVADHVQRWRLPGPTPGLEIPPLLAGDPPLAPVESSDLPPMVDLLDAPTIDQAGAAQHDVGLAVIDPHDPALVLAAPLEELPDPQHGAGLAAFDLRARTWRWYNHDACAGGMPVAIASARDAILCGSRGSTAGSGEVRALSRTDGTLLWTWRGTTVDAVTAAGGLAIVTVGRRAVLLDAATGAPLGEVAADDGFVPRLVAVEIPQRDLDGSSYGVGERGDTDVVVGVERGQVVARVPRAGMLPLWAARVDGTVVALGAAGGRITAELSGGELYLLDPETGAAIAAAGWSQRWHLLGTSDLLLSEPAIPAGPTWRLDAYAADGVARFTAEFALEPPWLVGTRGADPAAPVPLAAEPAARTAVLLDPRTGRATARYSLPRRSVPGDVFATVVDGQVVAGAVLSRPLGVVLFPP